MHQSPSPSFDTLVFVLADIKLVKRSVTVGPMNPNRNPFLIFNSIFGCDIKLIIIFFIISFSTTNAATFSDFQYPNFVRNSRSENAVHGSLFRVLIIENLFLLSLSTNLPIFSYFSLVFWK